MNRMRKLFERILIISLILILNSAYAQTTDSLMKLKQVEKIKYLFSYEDKEPIGIGVKAVVKAVYSLPQEEETHYFLVEVKLINNSDTLLESVTYSCTTYINIIYDTDKLKLFKFPCAGNYPIVLKLKPKQEFSIPILLKSKPDTSVSLDPVRFGFVVLNPKIIDFTNVHDKLIEIREKRENVIWSDPIYFDPANGRPYEIKTIVNDSTYIKQSFHRKKKI